MTAASRTPSTLTTSATSDTEHHDGSPDGAAARPVDLVHLSRYTLGDRALEREVLQLFRCQAQLYVTRLHTASTPDAWQAMAHTIKGSARSVGAWEVVDRAQALESLPATAGHDALDGAIVALDVAVGRACAYIKMLEGAE